MEMESTRRSSFDRSREQLGLKKPRLAEQQQQPNPNGRPFTQRPAPAGAVTAASASARFRVGSDRETESNDSRYQPQLQPYQELVSQYKTALAELTFNSKPIITNLTIIAGENLRAAKAIASTICANIIEVPSEQKLPSLYLLDSIVKNIGGDYIKYFAARLPEVFCKAYRQVDPSVHSSMQHLFGTWKGVFPPQALQMIEKELGFAPALNGSSSGAATSRPESQSQRPAHSIHVNPKYLERQRIQQSSRVKGMTNDLTVPTANSTGDVERPDRAVNIGAGHPWVDPPIKMPNLQSSQREALREPAQEKKKVGATFGDFEYGSGVARNPALGIGRSGGRVAEPGHGAGSNVQETLSVQRNGLSMNRGFPSLPASKSSAVELHLQPTQKIARSGSVMSTSWKNSEEEEYMWEMHSRLSDQDAANLSNNSRKDQWTPDDSDKLDLERFDGETSSDSLSTEQKEHAAVRHRSSSPWQLQESHLTDGLACLETTISTDHLEGYPASLSGIATSANPSLGKLAARLHMGSSHIGNPGLALSAKTASMSTETLGKQRFQSIGAASPSELSPMRQHMSSPSIQTHYPHLQNSAEQDYGRSQSLTRPDYRAQLSGNLLPSNVHRGNLPRLQPLDSQASSVPAFQLSSQRLVSQPRQPDSKESEASGQIQKACPPPVSDFGTQSISGNSASDHLNPITAATSGQSSTASLLAEVMKSGILSNINTGVVPDQNFQDTVKMQTQLSTQPPLPSGVPSRFSSSGSRITSASSIARRSHANSSSTVTNLSHRKEEQPPLPPGPPSSSAQTPDKASDPISNLLSTLVAKGLISSSNSETSSRKLPTESKNENASIMSSSSKTISPTLLHLSAVDEACCLEPDTKSSDALPQSTEGKIKSTEGKINILIGLEFKSDVIRELHPPVISALYDDLPHHCSICGLKLKLEEQLDRHLELHNRKKAELDGTRRETRRWYSELGNWVSGKEGLQLEGESSGLMDEFEVAMEPGGQMVLAHEDQCVCVLCGNLFEDCYSQERNKWMFKGAVHMTLPSGDGEVGTSKENAKGPIVHASCISESSLYDLGLTNGI